MLRVIVADDEETIRNGLVRLIQSCDLDLEVVATAQDGPTAVELVKRHRPHLLFMDINMPGMTGLEAIEAIRTHDRQVKIIIISGYGQFEYAQRALELGVSNYLLKPVDYRTFREILSRSMEDVEIGEEGPGPDLATRLTDYIKSHYGQELTVQALAAQFHTSPSNITRMLRQRTGQSFTDYLNHLRIQAAQELLLERDCTAAEVAERVGYSSQHYFSRVFKNYTGISPQRYRTGGRNP